MEDHKYPKGRWAEQDEGVLAFYAALSDDKTKLTLDFGKQVTWLEFEKPDLKGFIEELTKFHDRMI